MRKITKRSAAVIGATVVAIGGGAAWAAWGVIGSGSSTVVAGKSAELSLVSAIVDSPQLAPGAPADVKFTVTNPNKFPVKIESIVVDNVSTDTKTCPGSNVVPLPKAPLPTEAGALDVGANGGTKVITYKDAVRMLAAAPSDCQSVKFSVSLKLTGVSNATDPA